MNTRQAKLLAAIIDQFIETAQPVGSLNRLLSTEFNVSFATLRNEMRLLCDEGFLEQPHVSAGRIPTAQGYQLYVRDIMRPSQSEVKVRKKFNSLKEHYFQRKDQERAYEAVALLSHMIPNVAFATVPHKERVYYLGLANTLRQPEFQENPLLASGVVEVLEQRLSDMLEHIDIDDNVKTIIGDEHLLGQIQSCSMLVKRYVIRGERGTLGVLGPMRMDYAYNTIALDLVADLLHSN